MWSTAEPVVRDWMTRNLGPVGRLEDAADGAMSLGRFVGVVPDPLNRTADLARRADELTRNGIVLSPETVAAIGRAEGQGNRGMALALWIIAALLAVLVYQVW
jgi:ubiquinone biosynthesis protein